MTTRQLRLLRGAAVSSIATITAAVSHTLGGGAPPHPLLVLSLSILLTPLASLLVGRTLGFGRLSASVLLSQSVFHLLFVALGATLAPAASTGSATISTGSVAINTGHQHALTLGALVSGAAPDAGMLGAHIIAALFTIAVLWRGERLLRAIARWVRTALRMRMPRLHGDWPVPASADAAPVRFSSTIRTSALSSRGPPVIACG